LTTSRYTLLLSQTAVKQLKALPPKQEGMVREKLHLLQEHLFVPHAGLDAKRLRVSHDPHFFGFE